MKSTTKLTQVLVPIFLIFLICGLAAGMLYDLGYKMPIWLKIMMWLVIVSYPILNIVAILSIPTIAITRDAISSTSFFKHRKIHFDEISNIDDSVFKNKVYKIGKFYTICSTKGNEIDIPYGIYNNEQAIIAYIKKHTNTAK